MRLVTDLRVLFVTTSWRLCSLLERNCTSANPNTDSNSVSAVVRLAEHGE